MLSKWQHQIIGKPILEYQINCLNENGIKDIYILIGHLGNVIKDYFKDGSSFGVNIKYIEEKEPLGSAGSLYFLRNELNDSITFEVAIETSLSSISFRYSKLTYVKNLENGWTVVRFTVYKYNDEEEDVEPQEAHTVPFQVAYAVSIHKSQGLEYDSVKIIIANNVDELITHNVFYTAITRAKKKLMVYWTPETASKVLSSFEPHFDAKDSNIINNKYFK